MRDPRFTAAMDARRAMVAQAGRDNDRKFLETLGSMERYAWHEARKSVDPQHCNPYIMGDWKR